MAKGTQTPELSESYLDIINRIVRSIDLLHERLSGLSAPKWLSLKAGSQYSSISVTQLRRLIKAGKIPVFSINPSGERSKFVLRRYHLDQYLAIGHCHRPTKAQKQYLKEMGIRND